MLLSSSLGQVKYINPDFLFYFILPKCAPLSCNCPHRKDQLTNASSASQQDMKGKSTKEENLSFTFFQLPAHQKWTAKGQKDRSAKKIAALSPS